MVHSNPPKDRAPTLRGIANLHSTLLRAMRNKVAANVPTRSEFARILAWSKLRQLPLAHR